METLVVKDDEMRPHVVLIPFPVQGHIKCMLKLARFLHHKGLYITFVNTQSNHNRLLKSDGSQDFDDVPSFQFKTVPDGLPSTWDGIDEPTQTMEQLVDYLSINFLGSFLDLVAGLETRVTCIISDGFMTFLNTIVAAEKLRVPIMFFWSLAACGFMAYYHVKVLSDKGLVPIKDANLETLIDIPGMEGIRLKDLPDVIFPKKPDDPSLFVCLEVARAADKLSHIIIHTFDELEASVINELRSTFPQIYTVGPLQLHLNQITEKVSNKSKFNGFSLWKEEPDCVQWLNSKELKSVVYVSYGSLAVMSLDDLVEFGWGLVNSNRHFIWIIRTDLVDGGSAVFPPELEEMLKKKGYIANWCSQEEVLNHPSIGGFLTHGGWGSVIESLSAGVPMVCLPFSYDQRINCRQMCNKWEVGMEMGMINVKRDEVEKLVRELMEGVEGSKMRNKALEWKKIAEISTAPDGSSALNLQELVDEITALSRN